MSVEALPIDPLLTEIVQAVRANANVILTATPGAGKTTRLPPELLKAVKDKILILQPRRMAAVAACTRVCEERGWKLGEEAGYQVRFESKVTAKTRLFFMTDALLLRRMIDDAELDGVSLVVLDEFHERNLNQDLILGAVRELQEVGHDIKLLVMSATLDTRRLQKFLPGAHVVDVPGKVYPLEVHHGSQPLSQRTDFAFIDRVVEAATQTARDTQGDVLVFLPGTGEIARVQDKLEERRTGRDVVQLHGSLPLQAQQKVLGASETKRIILATNVAEASVTVNGVDRVIDTGLAKVMTLNTRTGFEALETVRISLFNARQRAGRAARQKAGICLRLWTPHEENTQDVEPTPECRRADLSPALLWLAKLGVSDFTRFAWFDDPPGAHLANAVQSLKALGALGEQDNRLTAIGEKLIRYPLPPRLGALLAHGEDLDCGTTAARLCAILNDRDFADQSTAHANTECDALFRLELLDEVERGLRPPGVNLRAAQTVLDSARQLEKLVRRGRDDGKVKHLLLLSQLDRLCRRRAPGAERALMTVGRGVRLHEKSQVRASEFFVALQGVDLPGQADTSIRLASGFDKSFVLQNLDTITREDVYFDEEKERFYARRVRYFRDLPLDEPTLAPADPAKVNMVEALTPRWDWLVSKHEALRAWTHRWNFLKQHVPELEFTLDQRTRVLELATFGKTKVSEVLAENLVAHVETILGPDTAKMLAREVPAKFHAPSGHTHEIHYEELHGAYVDVRLQEIFGLLASPKIALGRVPLTFRLLSPGFRPVQVTSDLENFWASGYREVRKELRLRYPKHAWPEDPYSAKPEAKGRPRR